MSLMGRLVGIAPTDTPMPREEITKCWLDDVATRSVHFCLFFVVIGLYSTFDILDDYPYPRNLCYAIATVAVVALLIVFAYRFHFRLVALLRRDYVTATLAGIMILLIGVIAATENRTDLPAAIGVIAFCACVTVYSNSVRVAIVLLGIGATQIINLLNDHHPPLRDQVIGMTQFLGVLFFITSVRDYIQGQLYQNRWQVMLRNQELETLIGKLRGEMEVRAAAEREVLQQKEQLRLLSQQLIALQETERSRLATELHDELGQVLTATRLSLDAARRELPSSERNRLDAPFDCIDEAIQQVRSLTMELKPTLLDHLGLESALQWNIDQWQRRTSAAIKLTTVNGQARFPRDVEAAAFRIVQEALHNSLRHGQPKQILVDCQTSPDALQLSVVDDGVGFDAHDLAKRPIAERGVGLVAMNERAELQGGKLTVTSSPGKGTRVEIVFRRPLVTSPRNQKPEVLA